MFSKATEYGIKAIIYVTYCTAEGRRISLQEIASEIDSPVSFTSKILQKLVKNKLLRSLKGPLGGFELGQPAETIRLSQLVGILEGDSIYKGCALGLKTCDEKQPCPLHFKFKLIRDDLRSMLEGTNLADLSIAVKEGRSFLKQA